MADCGRQEGPDIRLPPELSPDEAGVGLGDVLGEGQAEVSEGGEAVGQPGQRAVQSCLKPGLSLASVQPTRPDFSPPTRPAPRPHPSQPAPPPPL